MQLHELVERTGPQVVLRGPVESSFNPRIKDLQHDSRRVGPGSLFFAVEGMKVDSHAFLDEVVRKGAVGVVSERDTPQRWQVHWIQVWNIRQAMAQFAHRFFGEISRRMPLVGITGTNGKTTTAHMVHSILNQQSPTLMMGTVHNLFGDEERPARFTTPEAIEIQGTLSEGWQAGCRRGVLEVSSHALDLGRVFGCHFPVAVFTNITRDHLDYHETLEKYFQAKRQLFDPACNPGIRWAVVNGETSFSTRLQTSGVRCLTFGFSKDLDVFPHDFDTSIEGSHIDLGFRGRRLALHTHLAGEHNVYNAMAAATAASALGVEDADIRTGMEALKSVPGRFERVQVDHPAGVFVDYAHTPDALANVLDLCRRLTPKRIICVFGCGGDRDREKRPMMGEISSRAADWTIITTDNPRTENPALIAREVESGLPAGNLKAETVIDRREAIRRALDIAGAGDLVLVAGKGHETYQEIEGERIHFDDRETIRELAGP